MRIIWKIKLPKLISGKEFWHEEQGRSAKRADRQKSIETRGDERYGYAQCFIKLFSLNRSHDVQFEIWCLTSASSSKCLFPTWIVDNGGVWLSPPPSIRFVVCYGKRSYQEFFPP